MLPLISNDHGNDGPDQIPDVAVQNRTPRHHPEIGGSQHSCVLNGSRCRAQGSNRRHTVLKPSSAVESAMIRIAMLGLIAAAVFTVGGCASDEPVTSFDFEAGSQGWIAGFADYPEDGDPALFELDSSWEPLPSDLEGNALFIQGHNRSDDLFMYWKTPIHGLEPDTTYAVEIVVELATAVPGGLMGIGGSPARAYGSRLERPPSSRWRRPTIRAGCA